VKSLLALHDGKLVECVSIPTSERHTVCISSQVGCAGYRSRAEGAQHSAAAGGRQPRGAAARAA